MVINGYGIMDSLNRVASKNKREDSTMQKVTAGKRIIKAADDAAGLSIAESFKSQIRGLSQGEKNSQDAVSMLQVVDGALEEVTKQLHRMSEIGIQAANGTLTDADREIIDKEFQQLKQGIDSIAEQTEFNGIKLMKSDTPITIAIQYTPYVTYDLQLEGMTGKKIGVDTLSVTTVDQAQKSIGDIDSALLKVTSYRSGIGAHVNDLQHSNTNSSNNGVNLTAALSGVEDMDMASGMMKIIKNDLLANCNSVLYASLKLNAESMQKVL